MDTATHMLAIFNLGPYEIIIIGVVMLILFGNRLPEVMRSMGKGVVEFKRGLKETQNEISSAGSTPEPRLPSPDAHRTGESSQPAAGSADAPKPAAMDDGAR